MSRTIIFLMFVLCLQALGAEAEDARAPTPSGFKESVISGEISIADHNSLKRPPQLEAQDALLAWAAQLEIAIKAGGKGELVDLDAPTTSYLSALYLYCTNREGPCPYILESLLDGDLIKSRAQGEVSCTSINRFFKGYIRNQLDERGKFLYTLNRSLEMERFNTDERPRFLECKETLTAMLADEDVIKQRFGSQGTALESLTKLVNLLKEINSSRVDILAAVGVK